MQRFHQVVLLVSFLPLCWLAMLGVHELGHVLVGWVTGGTIVKVVVHPFTISRTDVAPNPLPLAVVWGGPLAGVVLPVLTWAAFRLGRLPWSYLLRFFAGFCLVANGAYIGIGSFDGIGDAGDMLRHGSPVWSLWLFGAVTLPLGFACWHGLGIHFGFGESRGRVDVRAAYLSACLLILSSTVALVLSPQS